MKRCRTAVQIFTEKGVVTFILILVVCWSISVAIVYFEPEFLKGNYSARLTPLLAYSGPVLILSAIFSIYFHQKKLDRLNDCDEHGEE